jgi:hypothetical protein
MTRLQKRLRETAQNLIDEVIFRFSVDSKEAQQLLAQVLVDQCLINAICVRVQIRRMDENNGGAQ